VGAAIAEQRVRQGWSRERLAAEAGVSLMTVYRVETGHLPRVEHLVAIAQVLGLSLDELTEVRRRASTSRRASQRSSMTTAEY
jgi:transcriptional regulator with XRE-family HTH domain